MGRLAKVFLFFIFVVALFLPRIALKVSDMLKVQTEKILQLESDVEGIKTKLSDSEKEKQGLQEKVEFEKRNRAEVEKTLASARKELDTAKAELKKREGELNSCVIERKKLAEDVKKLGEEKAALETKLSEQAKKMEGMTETVEPGTKTANAVPAEKKHNSAGYDGSIGTITGNRFVTISLGLQADVRDLSAFFIHRRERVIGKAFMRRIHGATIVVETSDEELLRNLRAGDAVSLEGRKLLDYSSFEGRIGEVSPHGFVGIDVDSKLGGPFVFVVSRDGSILGKITAQKVVSLFVIAELRSEGTRVMQGDYLRLPR